MSNDLHITDEAFKLLDRRTARVTVGLTESDRDANYVPSMDGYRDGATQQVVVLDLPLRAFNGEVEMTIAEAVFVATNAPGREYMSTDLQRAIWDRVEVRRTVDMRSLSVGDTVTFGDVRVVCERAGWTVR